MNGRKGECPSLVKNGRIIRCKLENHVPIVAVSEEPCVSPRPQSKHPGDRLPIPGAKALGDWSRMVPEWLQLFDEGLSGEPSDSENVVEPKGKTLDDMKLSSEEQSNDLPGCANMSKRPNTSKPTGRHHNFTHFFEDPNCKVCMLTKLTRAPSRKRPEARRRPYSSSTRIC